MNEHEDPLAWWRHNRLGMMIHFGIYSALAGEWNGRTTEGIAEWIQGRERIPGSVYAEYAKELTLERFDPAAYVELAKAAGMGHIVITAKHHDGFALYDSEVSDYNIVKRGPSGRDPIRELAEATRAAGLTFCLYYSQALDWADPDAVGNDWDYDPKRKDFRRYLERKCKPQLRELLTQYGPLGLIWFDVPMGITPEQSWELRELVKSIQPDCLVSSRIGGRAGDYSVLGDNQVPSGRLEGDWETPVTLNDTWGYKKTDHNWKSSQELKRLLAELLEKGANGLFNIGPRGDGSIPEESERILRDFGRWAQRNREAIQGTRASPFPSAFDWGHAATRGHELFLYVSHPQRPVALAGLHNGVRGARLLGAPDARVGVQCEPDGDGETRCVRLDVPEEATRMDVPVIALSLDGPAGADPTPRTQPDGTLRLPANRAEVQEPAPVEEGGEGEGGDVAVAAERFNRRGAARMHVDEAGVVRHWRDNGGVLHWRAHVDVPGDYELELRTLAAKYQPWVGGHRVRAVCGEETVSAVLAADARADTANGRYFGETASRLGTLRIPATGEVAIALEAETINPEDPVGLAVKELILRRAG